MLTFIIGELILTKILLKIFNKKLQNTDIGTYWCFGKQNLVISDEVIKYSNSKESYTFNKNEIHKIYNLEKYIYIIFKKKRNVIVVSKDKISKNDRNNILNLATVRVL